MITYINNNNEFLSKLWMSDETHFHLTGYINKQNYRHWVDTNPNEVLEHPLHASKVTVWYAASLHGIIRPFFFLNRVSLLRSRIVMWRYYNTSLHLNQRIFHTFKKPGFNRMERHHTLHNNHWRLCENCSVTVWSQDSVTFPGPLDRQICPFVIFLVGLSQE